MAWNGLQLAPDWSNFTIGDQVNHELYDHRLDTSVSGDSFEHETTNIAADEPALARNLSAQLHRIVAEQRQAAAVKSDDEGDVSELVVGPTYSVDPAIRDNGKPAPHRFTFEMPVGSASIFNGSNPWVNASAVSKTRTIIVNIPASYKDGSEVMKYKP